MRLVNIINNKISFYRVVRLRHRHLFTRGNKLRLRYIASTAVVTSLMLTSFLGSTTSSVAFAPAHLEITELKDNKNPLLTIEEEISILVETAELNKAIDNNDILPTTAPDIIQGAEIEPEIEVKIGSYEEIIKINPGGTIAGALQDAGISGAQAYRAIKVMSKYYDPRSIKPGQAISVYVEDSEDGLELTALNMKISPTEEIIITRDEKKVFSSKLDKKKIILQKKAAKAEIETSLYGSAARAGIPASIVAEMIRIYSYDIDFQRDIRRGDKVEVLYETYETEDGDFARYGNVLYANLMVGGRNLPVYRYETKKGDVDYYHNNGVSLRRILMQTPVDGARMSSGYGMRRHPVLGYNKMHKGVDFAASRGTPIYAAGNGVIERAGRNGGYRNYIRIRHKNGLKTAYAHMKKFAKGIKKGKRVEQGNIIGYVGTTGRSTGPHLHFEVLKNGKQVNPKSIKASSGDKLVGRSLKDFQARILAVKQQYVVLAQDLKFALNELE